MLDHVDAGGERVGRRDHLVAAADAERDQRQMERAGRRIDREAVLRSGEAGDALGQLVGAGARRDPARLQRLEHETLLDLTDPRHRQRQKGLADRRPTGRGQGFGGVQGHGRMWGRVFAGRMRDPSLGERAAPCHSPAAAAN